MKRTPIIAVIGSSSTKAKEMKLAQELGGLIAKEGWILLNGGLGGVMEASAKGASLQKGMVVGIVPGPSTAQANPYVGIPLATNMGHARNVIIAHSANALIAVGGEYGTLSEIAIGLKLGKLVVGLESQKVDGMVAVKTAQEAIAQIKNHFTKL